MFYGSSTDSDMRIHKKYNNPQTTKESDTQTNTKQILLGGGGWSGGR